MSLETNHGLQTSLIYLVQNNFLKTLFEFEDFCLLEYNPMQSGESTGISEENIIAIFRIEV
jgi:hypothetical protein